MAVTPEDWRAIRASAYLAYARSVAGWHGPRPEPTSAPTGEPRPVGQRPHRGTEAWRRELYRAPRAEHRRG